MGAQDWLVVSFPRKQREIRYRSTSLSFVFIRLPCTSWWGIELGWCYFTFTFIPEIQFQPKADPNKVNVRWMQYVMDALPKLHQKHLSFAPMFLTLLLRICSWNDVDKRAWLFVDTTVSDTTHNPLSQSVKAARTFIDTLKGRVWFRFALVHKFNLFVTRRTDCTSKLWDYWNSLLLQLYENLIQNWYGKHILFCDFQRLFWR